MLPAGKKVHLIASSMDVIFASLSSNGTCSIIIYNYKWIIMEYYGLFHSLTASLDCFCQKYSKTLPKEN